MATFPVYPSRRADDLDAQDAPGIWNPGTTNPAASDGALQKGPQPGDLFLDTNAGSNGTLVCYANGAWRTVKAL